MSEVRAQSTEVSGQRTAFAPRSPVSPPRRPPDQVVGPAPGPRPAVTVLWRNRQHSTAFDPLPTPEPLPEVYIAGRVQWLSE